MDINVQFLDEEIIHKMKKQAQGDFFEQRDSQLVLAFES